MKIKSAKSFRFWYKTKVKEIDKNNPSHNENFVGSLHPNKRHGESRFVKLIYRNREDLDKLLGVIADQVTSLTADEKKTGS
jgi:hypothetical protein